MNSVESEHTPGPWYVDTTDTECPYSICQDDEHGWGIAEVKTFGPIGTNAANAALIAAAPDMYEALRLMVWRYEDTENMDDEDYPELAAARAALAKAEGR